MNEWGTGNEKDFMLLLISFVFFVFGLLVISAIFVGCAPAPFYIGNGVSVRDIKIRKCENKECIKGVGI